MFELIAGKMGLKQGPMRPAGQGRPPRIGQILLKRGVITQAQLEMAVREQAETGERVGKILVAHGFATSSDLSDALSTQHKYISAFSVLLLQACSIAFPGSARAEPERDGSLYSSSITNQGPAFAKADGRVRFTNLFQDEIKQAQERRPRSSWHWNLVAAELAKLNLSEGVLRNIAKYLPYVKQASDRFGVPPGLILGIIHTESHFKHRAKSAMNAHGLMQIVPKFAGIDAYFSVFKKKGKPTLMQLRDPRINILLGTAYLCKLDRYYFKNIANDEVRQAAVIAAYNVGPTKLMRVFKHQGEPKSMEELQQTLARHAPQETQNYLIKVRARGRVYTAAQSNNMLLAKAH